MRTATYSYAREHLDRIWDEIEDAQEEVILTRHGHEDLALLPARERRSLRETTHLLRSPRNATRLIAALVRSRANDGTEFDFLEKLGGESRPSDCGE